MRSSASAPASDRPACAFRLGYRPELDGLRGLAVLMVMAYHSYPQLLPGGFVGVDVFFVLSGFLITVLLVREHEEAGRVRLGRFYGRRALRLFPALFVMLAVCCAVISSRVHPEKARALYQAALLTACHGANFCWIWSIGMDMFGHTWSLSLEEQFYLVWPAVLCVLLRLGFGLRGVGRLAAFGIAASILLRAAVWAVGSPPAQLAATVSLACRADSLLAGCVVGLLAVAGRLPAAGGRRAALHGLAGASALLIVGACLLAPAGRPYLYLGGYAGIGAAAALVVAGLVSAPPRLVTRLLSSPGLVWVGGISYGLYLWHCPALALAPKLMHGVLPFTHGFAGLNEPLGLAAAFGAAVLSYYVVERPFLRWKARLGAPEAPIPVICARSDRLSGPGTPAASSGRASCPA
jgi:peptidoglycan/LPS O-acetylase OafA/YrhL